MAVVGDLSFALAKKAYITEDVVTMEIPMVIPNPNPSPYPPQPKDLVVKDLKDSPIPLYMKLRRQLHWWKQHATPQVLDLIQFGLPGTEIHPDGMRAAYQRHTSQETHDACSIMSEYLEVSAVRLLSKPPRTLVPWFMVYHSKPRSISNCVAINRCLEPPPYFRLPNGGTIFFIQRHWAIEIYPKHAYFPPALCPKLEGPFNFQDGSQYFQCRSACFRLHYIPYVMNTFLRK